MKRADVPCAELSRFLYTAVGGEWYWVDRLVWTYDQGRQYAARPDCETWLLLVSGTPAGYFELDGEIAYFGLLSQFVGQGLGGYLLTAAIQRAWERGARRVWVHTLSLDHPAALGNYFARGFHLYRQEITSKELPDRPPGRPATKHWECPSILGKPCLAPD